MSRHISFFIVVDNELININNYIVRILDYKGDYDYLKVNGCGMDMSFSVVYNLSSCLYSGIDRAGYILKSEWV